MSINHLISGGPADVSLNVKSLEINGIPVTPGGGGGITNGKYTPFINFPASDAFRTGSTDAYYEVKNGWMTVSGRQEITCPTFGEAFIVRINLPAGYVHSNIVNPDFGVIQGANATVSVLSESFDTNLGTAEGDFGVVRANGQPFNENIVSIYYSFTAKVEPV
jgi:hypothetical protein